MLTDAQLAARDGKVTASFVPALMAADSARILNEWRRLVGDPGYQPEDFADNWPVQFGSFVEPFALDWHARRSGHSLTRRGEVVVCPARPHVSCTLDAWREADDTVLDVKAPGMWRKLPDVIAHYTAQMVVQRACVGAANAALLIVHGGSEPAEHPVAWTLEYEAEVWARIDWFWGCVKTLTAPIEIAPVAPPAEAVKIVDMSESNAWCDAATTWRETRAAAALFDGAAKAIKGLVPTDAARAFGAGVTVSRARNGALTIKEDAR